MLIPLHELLFAKKSLGDLIDVRDRFIVGRPHLLLLLLKRWYAGERRETDVFALGEADRFIRIAMFLQNVHDNVVDFVLCTR